MRVAVLDIGSNTSVLLIAKLYKESDKSPDILEDQVFFTRLAEDFFKDKIIKKSAFERQKNFFKKAREQINQYSVSQIKCVATAVVRNAQNKQELLDMGTQYGFCIEVISGEIEAKISRKGALFNLPVKNSLSVVLDIGGASTEISTEDNFLSLPIGSVNLTEEFFCTDPPKKTEIDLLHQNIQTKIESVAFSLPAFLSKKFILVATAGTPITLACLKHKTKKLDNLHGEKISFNQVQYWQQYLFQLPYDKRKALQGMPFYRADVMPAGLSILKQFMQYFEWNECVISITGLRYGLLYDF